MSHYLNLTGKMNEQLLKVYQYKLHLWKKYVLFDWHWWFGIILTIIPIVLWLLFHDKKSTASLLLAGLTAALLAAFLDTTFLFLGFFDYKYEVAPMASNYIPWNFFAIPVLIMFTIQLFDKINVYLKGIILSLLVSYICLPLLKRIDILYLINWHYFYSLLAMFFIFVISYQVSKVAKNKNQN